MNDIAELPINKYLLSFKESDLENEYQEKRRIYAVALIRSLTIKVTLLLTPIYIYHLYLFLKSGQKGKNIDDPIATKRIFITIVGVPFFGMVGLFEIFFSKFQILSKVRCIFALLIILALIGSLTVFYFRGQDVFDTIALFAILIVQILQEQLIYSWLVYAVSLFLGIIIMFLILISGNVEIISHIMPGFIALFIFSVIYSRVTEAQTRREFYTLHCVKEREKELKNIMSSLPIGIIIHEKGLYQEERIIQMSEQDSQEKIKFWNPALDQMLKEDENMNHMDHSEQIIPTSRRINTQDPIDIEENLTNTRNAVNNFVFKTYSGWQGARRSEIDLQINNRRRQLNLEHFNIVFENKVCTGLIIEDLTYIREIERQSLSQEFQSKLVKTITHEVRTPLNAISGSIDIIEGIEEKKDRVDFQNSQNVQFYIKIIQNGVRFLQEFVDCMLQLSNYQGNGEINVKYEIFDINEVINDMISLFQIEMNLKGIIFDIKLDIKSPKQIYSDRTAISQTVFILVSNSLKYTFEGHIEVLISYNYDERKLEIRVRDTGIGIREEEMKHLFELYPHSSIKPLHSEFGSGIGLTLCKVLVTSMKGSIYLESEPGVGTTVTLTIPIQTDKEIRVLRESEEGYINMYMIRSSVNSLPSNIEEHKNSFCINTSYQMSDIQTLEQLRTLNAGRVQNIITNITTIPIPSTPRAEIIRSCNCNKIMVVDDVQSNIFILKGLLKLAFNIDADEAKNGQEAVDSFFISKERSCCGAYSLIFMDCNMPIMDGYTAAARIKYIGNTENLAPCVIIAVTAYADPKNTEMCVRAGMDMVLAKPISMSVLKNALANYLSFGD